MQWFPTPSLPMVAMFIACLIGTKPVWAGELLLFPSVTGVMRSASNDSHKKSEIEPGVDIFLTMERAPIQLLAEFFVNPDERELERLQIGIAPSSNYKIWVGRFHTPISYWNMAYHHGSYMQTSITRPGIAEYEDEQGVMPMHTTGFLLDGLAPFTKNQLNYSVALGFGPVLKESLEPVNIFKPKERGKLSITAKLGLQPLSSEVNETGIFAGYIKTPIESQSYSQTNQLVTGLYSNTEWGPWRLVGEITQIRFSLESVQGDSREHLVNAYLQGEFKTSHQWTGYARLEESNNAHTPYLDMFPGFIAKRTLIGARWEPLQNHAIKFELASSERQDNYHSNQFGMQWSMVFP